MPIIKLVINNELINKRNGIMSFDVRPVRQPMIQNSQSMKNDGGGGNLGYMRQGKKKKDEEENNNNIELLNSNDSLDSIQLCFEEDNEEQKNESSNFLNDIVKKIANTFNKKTNNPFQNT